MSHHQPGPSNFTSYNPSSISSSYTEAENTAIQLIQLKFNTSESLLSKIQSTRIDYEKLKLTIDNQLSNLIHTHIEDSRYSLELLLLSCKDIKNIRANFNDIDNLCINVINDMPNYEPIKKVAVARDNLATTIGLLQLFRSIPEKASELEAKLNDDRELKNIYKEIRRMVALRDKAFSKGLQYNSDNNSSTAAIYSESFEALQRVATSLEERVWENITDCIILGQGDPATLVRTIEVIEMEDREKVKIFSHDLVRTNMKSEHKDSLTMRERCMTKLEEEIMRKFHSFSENKNVPLSDLLRQADELMEDLSDICDFVVQCFPKEYKIFEFFEKRYQTWMHSRLMDSIGNPQALPPGEILLTVKWIQNYKLKMLKLGADLNAASELESFSVQLMDSYVTQSKKTMLEWVSNIIKRERTTLPMLDESTGVYSTNATQDLYMMTINQQVDVSFKQLRGKNFVNVMKTCVDVLLYFQQESLAYLNDPAAEKTEEYLAAVANTLHDCSEETSRLKDKCATFLEDDDCADLATNFEEIVDDVITGFVSISNLCCHLLAVNIMKTVTSVMEKAFTSEWVEKDTWAEETIITLQDFFGDYSRWLASEYYFGRVVKDVAHEIVSVYIQKFIYAKPYSNKPDQIVNRLLEDVEKLEDYLTSDDFNQIVPPKVFEDEFESVRKIVELLGAEETFMTVYFDPLISRFGPNEAQKLFAEVILMKPEIDRSTRKELIERFRQKANNIQGIDNNNNSDDDNPAAGLFSWFSS